MLRSLSSKLAATALPVFLLGSFALAETNLRANLNGDAESPPVASLAGGVGEFTINDENTEIDYTLIVSNIENTTAAHIHVGAFATPGPIIFTLSSEDFGDNLSDTLTQENFTPQPAQGINTFADAINAIRAGNTYVNVHTEQHPNGEVRGQLIVIP